MLTGKGRANHGHILREAARMAESGQLMPLMDPRRYTLDTALEAHQEVEHGRARGRLVVEV